MQKRDAVNCKISRPFQPLLSMALDRCVKELESRNGIWVVAYSGGKDSSLCVQLILSALHSAKCNAVVKIVYVDTGVEAPLLAQHARLALVFMDDYIRDHKLRAETQILTPRLEDRFLVRAVGRGYSAPTTKFRWCTKKLKLRPLVELVRGVENVQAIVTGLRLSESSERRRTIQFGINESGYMENRTSGLPEMFLPIANFDEGQVWRSLLCEQNGVSARYIASLMDAYAGASYECSTAAMSLGTGCGSRFGCWTCTLVGEKTMLAGTKAPDALTAALFGWRKEYRRISRNYESRWAIRRDGSIGPGPILIRERKRLFEMIEAIELQYQVAVVSEDERVLIREHWLLDSENETRLSVESTR